MYTIDEISSLPFKGYIAFGQLHSEEFYEALYFSLVKSLLSDRFMGCDNAFVDVIFEENSRINPARLKELVSKIYGDLEKTKNRRPTTTPEVIIGKKADHPCFSIPDFLLGVWGDYIKKQDSDGDAIKLCFELLRDKYRIILNIDKKIVFSRKRPFLAEHWQ